MKKRENHEKPWKKRETQQITQKISSSIHLLFLGSSRESPTASAAASPATSGADMEQIWREKQLRGKETSPHFLPWKWEYIYLRFSTNCGHFSQKWQNVGEIIDSNTII